MEEMGAVPERTTVARLIEYFGSLDQVKYLELAKRVAHAGPKKKR